MKFNLLSIALALSGFSVLFAGCSDDNEDIPEPEKPIANLLENKITISNIIGIPEDITFDKVKVSIQGIDWSVIDIVEASYKEGSIVLVLPSSFTSEQLLPIDCRDKRIGFWQGSVSVEPDALVASMDDNIFAYNGTKKVGRIRLTNKIGQTSDAVSINYIYGNMDYTLNGWNNNYLFSNVPFKKGWNAFAKINPTNEEAYGDINCTTSFSEDDLRWYFVEPQY